MRSPLALLSSLRSEKVVSPDSLTASIDAAVGRGIEEIGQRTGATIEAGFAALRLSLKERLDDLYGETWRLRDTIDSRLGAIEKKMEATSSRLEIAIEELGATTTQLQSTCQALTLAMQEQLRSSTSAAELLREAHERRLRQLEENQRAQIATLERKHRDALRSQADSQSYVLGRVRAVAEQMDAELESRTPSPFDSIHETFITSALKKFKKRLQDGRVEELEEAVRAFAKRLAELGQTEELLTPTHEAPIPIITSYGQPAVPGSAKGNGNGRHELDLSRTRG